MNKSSQEIATVNTEAKQGTQRKEITLTRRITYLATFIAASLALKLVGQVFQTLSFKFTLVYVPWIISAIVMGPLCGMTVALSTDLLGTFMMGGVPNPILAFSCALFGLITGYVFMIPKLNPKIKLLIATVIVIPVCTFGVWSIGMATYYGGKTIFGWMATRIPQAVVVALNSVAVAFMFPLMRKLGLME